MPPVQFAVSCGVLLSRRKRPVYCFAMFPRILWDWRRFDWLLLGVVQPGELASTVYSRALTSLPGLLLCSCRRVTIAQQVRAALS